MWAYCFMTFFLASSVGRGGGSWVMWSKAQSTTASRYREFCCVAKKGQNGMYGIYTGVYIENLASMVDLGRIV